MIEHHPNECEHYQKYKFDRQIQSYFQNYQQNQKLW